MPDFRLPKPLEEGLTFFAEPPFFPLELLEFVLKSRDLGLGLEDRSGFLVGALDGARCPAGLDFGSDVLGLDSEFLVLGSTVEDEFSIADIISAISSC